MIQKVFKTVVLFAVLMSSVPANATKVLGLKVIDKNYLMVHFRDGEVHYRDDGTGPSAYLGHSFSEGDDTLLVFGERLKVDRVQQAALWRISSADDKAFGSVRPQHVWRKTKPMNFDHTLTAELDHWLFLQLPKAMKQGCTYTVTIPKGIGADATSGMHSRKRFMSTSSVTFPLSRRMPLTSISGWATVDSATTRILKADRCIYIM